MPSSRGSDEEGLKNVKGGSTPLAIWLWDWFYEMKSVVALLLTAFYLPQYCGWAFRLLVFFHSKKKNKFIKPQNSISQHLFTLHNLTEYVWKENGRNQEDKSGMAPFLNSFEDIWFLSSFTPLLLSFPPNSFTLCAQKVCHLVLKVNFNT